MKPGHASLRCFLMLLLFLAGCASPPGVGQKDGAHDAVNPPKPPAGMRPAAVAALKAGRPYPYPLRPGTRAWNRADPYDRVDSVVIPQAWLDAATSWQLFCSAVANPYFHTLWVMGDSLTESYAAARASVSLSILKDVEARPDFGANTLRFLAGFDLPRALADESEDREPCLSDYMVVCQMAGLPAALESMDEDARLSLLRLAVWDAHYLVGTSNYVCAAAPIRLIYTIYDNLSTHPAGLTLTPLNADQSRQLDRGFLPGELVAVARAAREALALTSRPVPPSVDARAQRVSSP